jgi:hypothetical protein
LKCINKIAEEKGKKNMKNLSKIRFLVADQSGESIPPTIFALWLNHSGAQGRLNLISLTSLPNYLYLNLNLNFYKNVEDMLKMEEREGKG